MGWACLSGKGHVCGEGVSLRCAFVGGVCP